MEGLWIEVDVDPERVTKVRAAFPALEDRHPFPDQIGGTRTIDDGDRDANM